MRAGATALSVGRSATMKTRASTLPTFTAIGDWTTEPKALVAKYNRSHDLELVRSAYDDVAWKRARVPDCTRGWGRLAMYPNQAQSLQ